MNVFKLLKGLLIFLIIILLVMYLGNLLLMMMSAYILFSMLHPLKVYIQKKLKISSSALSSVLALIFPSLIILMIIFYVFPVIITQLNSLTYLSYEDVFENIIRQFPYFETIIAHLGGKKYVLKSIQDILMQVINIGIIAHWSSVLLNNFSHIMMNLLITFFITFHLLKDENIIHNILDKLVDKSYEKDISSISDHIKEILGKYFRGLLIDISIIAIVNSVILSILGIKNAVLIGLLSGILNIIPYVGPLITLLIGLFLGVSSNIIEGHYEWIGGTVLKIFTTLFVVNIIDGTVLQPYIFSNVLKAHPLEIFLVIVAAGMMGGIVWMMLIIPIYVIAKVAVKEIYAYWKTKSDA